MEPFILQIFYPPRVKYSLRDMRNEYNILVIKIEGKILFHSYSVHGKIIVK